MSFEYREDEAQKWSTGTWGVRTKNPETNAIEFVDTPINQLKQKHALNVIKWIKKRYTKAYKETYIKNSKTWIELNRVAGTDYEDLDKEPTHPAPQTNTQQAVPQPTSTIQNAGQDADLSIIKTSLNSLTSLINEEITAIKDGKITNDQVVDFLSLLSVKLTALSK